MLRFVPNGCSFAVDDRLRGNAPEKNMLQRSGPHDRPFRPKLGSGGAVESYGNMDSRIPKMNPAERRAFLSAAASEIAYPFRTAKTKARLTKQKAYFDRLARRRERPKQHVPDLKSDDQGVYVIGSAGHPIKIGITNNVRARLSSLRTSSPADLRVYAFMEAPEGRAWNIEQECHRRIADYRLNGEWFNYDPYDAIELVRRVIAENTST